MSDPVTNAEVEDVLSSIRRLVSEDKRPLQARKPSEGADRLVLTPALRVEDPEKSDDQQGDADMPSAEITDAQDTVGETARQLFDPSDDLPTDVYDRPLRDMPAADAEEEDRISAMPEDDQEAVAEGSDMPSVAFSHRARKTAADDYSDDPYGFAEEGSENTNVEEAEADVEKASLDADTSVADNTTEAENASSKNDTFDFESLRRRDPDAAPAASEPVSADAEPDGEEPVWAVATPDLQTDADPLEGVAAESTDDEPTADEPVADAPEADREAGLVAATKAATLSAKIAALETAIGNIADTWEPDTPGTDDYSGTDQPAMAWEDDVSRDATGVPLRSEAAQAAWQDAHPDVVMIGTARAAVIAAAAQEKAEAEAEASSADEEPTAPAPMEQADADQAAKNRAIAAARMAAAERVAAEQRAAAERKAALSASQEAPVEDEPVAEALAEAAPAVEETTQVVPDAAAIEPENDYSDEGQMLDEEMLRDLVSEIVRSELQGALGERITRNVRKLVRREIHRALTAQELE